MSQFGTDVIDVRLVFFLLLLLISFLLRSRIAIVFHSPDFTYFFSHLVRQNLLSEKQRQGISHRGVSIEGYGMRGRKRNKRNESLISN